VTAPGGIEDGSTPGARDQGQAGGQDPRRLARALLIGLKAEIAHGIDVVPVPREPETRPETSLSALEQEVAACTRCGLCRFRHQTVFGEGPPSPRLMFIGEGPGAEEDREGRPFVGPAGKLLDRIIAAAQLRREDVYITNIVKCRPPRNRAPNPDEAGACGPYLREQIRLLDPEVICALGAPAARAILDSDLGINRLRGKRYPYPVNPGIVVIPTFHPAYLLRRPEDKGKTWSDIQMVMRELGIKLPKHKS